MTEQERRARIHDLEQRIADLRARLPKHSPPASMMIELDELEDELRRLSGESSHEDKKPREEKPALPLHPKRPQR